MFSCKNVFVVVLACLVVVGCDSGDGGETAESKPDAQSKLIGSWVLDVPATKAALPDEDQSLKTAVSAMLDGMALSFEFRDDMTYEGYQVAVGNRSDFTGKWTIVEKSENAITIETQDDGVEHANSRKITFTDNDSIIFDNADGKPAPGGLVPHLIRKQTSEKP